MLPANTCSNPDEDKVLFPLEYNENHNDCKASLNAFLLTSTWPPFPAFREIINRLFNRNSSAFFITAVFSTASRKFDSSANSCGVTDSATFDSGT